MHRRMDINLFTQYNEESYAYISHRATYMGVENFEFVFLFFFLTFFF